MIIIYFIRFYYVTFPGKISADLLQFAQGHLGHEHDVLFEIVITDFLDKVINNTIYNGDPITKSP